MRMMALILLVAFTGCSGKSADPPAAPPTATLKVSAKPYDTEVSVNGEKRGKTPLTIQVRPDALYTVAPAADPSNRQDVTFGYADTSTKEVILELGTPLITLNRIPYDAKIKLDGKALTLDISSGSTMVETTIGQHRLEITSSKKPWTQQVTLTPEKPRVSVTVEELKLGSLDVTGPAGARVFIDDFEHGKTPLNIKSLTPGEHVLRVIIEGAKPRRQTVTIKGGGTVKVDLSGEADRWVELEDGFSYADSSVFREAPGVVEVWLRGPMTTSSGTVSEAQVFFDMNKRTYTRSDVPNFKDQAIPPGSVWERIGSALAQ